MIKNDVNQFIYKFIFLLFIFIIIRVGSHITIPAVNPILITEFLESFNSQLLTMINTFSGGSVMRFSILMLGIMPFITAAIIMQLLSLTIPKLKELKENGEKGIIEINKYTKYLAFCIATFQAFTVSTQIVVQSINGQSLITTDIISFYIISVISLIFGVFVCVWLAEKINKHGMGNGVTMIIFLSIISSIPSNISNIKDLANIQTNNLSLLLFTTTIIALTAFIVFIENSKRQIKLINPNSMNSNSHLPIKVNLATIMPAIFTFMIITFSQTIDNQIEALFGFSLNMFFQNNFAHSNILFWITVFIAILLFSIFYGKTVFNTKSISDNLRKSNTYIKGIRPNKPTIEYLNNIRNRLSFISGSYMFIVVITPEIINYFTGIAFYLGGISLLILVVVSNEIKNNWDLINNDQKLKKLKRSLSNKFK